MRAFLVFFYILCSGAVFAATLQDIKISSDNSKLTLTLKSDMGFGYTHSWLDNPPRLVIEAYNLSVPQQIVKNFSHKDIVSLKIKQENIKNKLIFELRVPYKIKLSETTNSLTFTLSPKNKTNTSSSSLSPPKKEFITIVIDPGHGGKDPGSSGKIGKNKYLEKDLALSLSKKIKSTLENSIKNSKIFLTRDTDIFITLDQRLTMAQKNEADLFISIHYNSINIKGASSPAGLMVFNLAMKESSEMAKILTHLENQDLLDGRTMDDSIDRAVLDISMKASMAMSKKISDLLLGQAKEQNILVFRDEVERGRFLVLKSPNMASILLEIGFLSNSNDLKKLVNKDYQASLAKTIAIATKDFFTKYSDELGTPLPK